MFKFQCDNCGGTGKVTSESCCMCDGKGYIGLFFKLVDLILRLYYRIVAQFVIWQWKNLKK